jgi:hypothetical protein
MLHPAGVVGALQYVKMILLYCKIISQVVEMVLTYCETTPMVFKVAWQYCKVTARGLADPSIPGSVHKSYAHRTLSGQNWVKMPVHTLLLSSLASTRIRTV